MQQNLISEEIPQSAVDTAAQLLTQVATVLKPYLKSLTPEERRGLSKMGDKTLPFVNKALAYADNEPAILPNYIDLQEGHKDANTANQFDLLARLGFPLMQAIEDTLMMAGSDALAAGLGIYGGAQGAAKNNVPGAATIVADLG
jgi:hypothetical protein